MSSTAVSSLRRRVGVNVAALILIVLLVAGCGVTLVAAVGCGEPLLSLDQTCSDPQCSFAAASGDATFCVRGRGEGQQCAVDADCYIELFCATTNGTSRCAKKGNEKVAWKGYIAAAVAVFAFGSNFIPARRVEPGNGLFFQFFMSTAILIGGFITMMVRGSSTFYPYAMIGGVLWCVGNTLAMPALKLVSMGLAVSLWGSTNMLLGWASGHFGFWGINKEEVQVPWMSYCSVAFAALGVVMLAFVKKSSGDVARRAEDLDDIGYHSVTSSAAPITNPFDRVEFGEKEDIGNYLSRKQQRILGTCLAVGAGCFFGVNFDPPTRLMDSYAERSLHEDVKYSPNGLDYVFSHFFGIFCTALGELVLFQGVDTFVNLPSVFPGAAFKDQVVPGFICGVGWAIAQISWFIANDNLGLVLSFPVIALGPSIVSCAWSVFLFREIRGTRNYIFLAIAFVLLAIAATCTVFARNGF